MTIKDVPRWLAKPANADNEAPIAPQGNRQSVTRDGATSTYGTYGDNDQLSSGDGFAFSNYDNDGNPGTVSGSGGTMYFTYDEMGRTTAISGVGASTFRYDGDGRRVERAAGGSTTRFVYDGDQAVLETNGSNAVTPYRLPGVGYVKGGSQFYEQENAQGTVLAVRNSGAQAYQTGVVGRTDYDAYGVELVAVGSERGGQRFAGQRGYQNDDATGMQLLGARYYLPLLGRFLTQDPVGHEGGLNLYAYCEDSPLGRTDETGLKPDRWLPRIAVIAGSTEGAAGLAWPSTLLGFPGEGQDYRVLSTNGPSKQRAIQILSYVDAAVIWGHGAPGHAYINYTELLDAKGMERISGNRHRLGLSPTAFLNVEQCDVLASGAFINAALGVASRVTGYDALTFNNTGPIRTWGFGIRRTYDSCVYWKYSPTAMTNKKH